MKDHSILSAIRLIALHGFQVTHDKHGACLKHGRKRWYCADFVVPALRERGLIDAEGRATKRGEEEAK